MRFNYILFINADNVIQHIYYPEQIRSKTILITTEFECKLGITWEQIRSKTILLTTEFECKLGITWEQIRSKTILITTEFECKLVITWEQIRSKTILLTTEFECKLVITWVQIRSKTILITTKSSLPSAYYVYLQHKNTSPQFTKVIFVTLKSHCYNPQKPFS
ncbi:MAG: hypothetical protein PUC90_04415 [Prevotella sp.]|nr:hypothetical protein [Prevotella sp.]